MKIYIVSKVVDELDSPSTTTVSAHVDKGKADAAAQAVAGTKVITSLGGLASMTYGVVETIELDLTGLTGEQAVELQDAAIAAGWVHA